MLKYCIALIISAMLQISNAQNSGIVTSIGTPTISIVPGCSSCYSSRASQTSVGGQSSTFTSSPNSIDTHENKIIIIASSISAGGLLVIVSFLICCLYRRKQKRVKLNSRARNIQRVQTEIDEKEVYSSLNNEAIKKYNINKNELSDEKEKKARKNSLPTPPVILYSDIMKKEKGTEKEGRKKNSVDLTSRTSAISNGTRLSKYNFLAQAFTQMRESYMASGTQNLHLSMVDDTHMKNLQAPSGMAKPEPLHRKESTHRNFHDSMVLTKYDFDDGKSRPLSIPETIQTSSAKSVSPDIRESTITVATLHAPLFKNNGFHHPMPQTIRSNTPLYQSPSVTPNNNLYRDSVVSDVSQFSTWPVARSSSPDEEEAGIHHKPIKL